MKSPVEIYNERKELTEESKALRLELRKKEEGIANLQKECPHNLVLAFDDQKPHKIGTIIECYCPVCSKREYVYPSQEIEKSVFKNSKLIYLKEFPTNTHSKSFSLVIEHIIDNYDYYYSNNINEDDLTESIRSIIENNSKTLKKKKI